MPCVQQELATNIYIRGLSSNATDVDLESLCSSFGVIISAKAIVDPNTGHCKGFGFVLFATETEALDAIRGLQSTGYYAAKAKIGPRRVNVTSCSF